MREVKGMDENAVFSDTCRYWCDFLKTAVPVNTGDRKLDSLYRRSVLHFKLMSDERYGGIPASPEVDEGIPGAADMPSAGEGCGVYYRRDGQVWPSWAGGEFLPLGG